MLTQIGIGAVVVGGVLAAASHTVTAPSYDVEVERVLTTAQGDVSVRFAGNVLDPLSTFVEREVVVVDGSRKLVARDRLLLPWPPGTPLLAAGPSGERWTAMVQEP